MIKQIGIAAILLVASVAQAQNVTVKGEEGTTFRSLIGSSKLVTIVLDVSGNPEDPNVRITDSFPTYFKGVKPNGEEVIYTYELVKELRVQNGRVEQQDFSALKNPSLSAEQLEVVNLGWQRMERLFNETDSNQALKIRVAGVLGSRGDERALDYLNRIVQSNDLLVQYDAAAALYLAGQSMPEGLLRAGFESGRFDIMAYAAKLAGLFKDKSSLPQLQKLVDDRAEELSAPAAVALARLGERSVVPKILKMLTGSNVERGEAALVAIKEMGDENLISELTPLLDTTEGNRRFRVVRALHALDSERGTEELKKTLEILDKVLAPDAARLLAKDGFWPACQYLRDRLNRREDPTEQNFMNRVRNSAALIAGEDSDALAELQNMLAADSDMVKILACNKIAELQKRTLLSLLRPGINNVSKQVSFNASTAAITFAEDELRDRYFKLGVLQ